VFNKKNWPIRIWGILVMMIPFLAVVSCFGISLPDEIAESDHILGMYDTNQPLLAMDWFVGPHSVQVCHVSQSGQVFSARNVINWAIQGGQRKQLDASNLALVVSIINSLPPTSSQALPRERLLVVRGMRTNQWFEYVYDREHVPDEIEKLYQMTGGYLEWFIPKVSSNPMIHTSFGNYYRSQAGIASFHIATMAPIAVSSGVNGIQIWDLRKKTVKPLMFLEKMPGVDFGGPFSPAVISPDGNIIACASTYGTLAVDWRAEKILWQTNSLVDVGRSACLNTELAIGGDKGQFLYVGAAHKIERWDIYSGKCLGSLDTNHEAVSFLETSRDGKILVVGFLDNPQIGGCIQPPNSISIWKSGEDIPSAHMDWSGPAGIGISPDGRRIALSIFEQQKLFLWNWQKGITNEVFLRVPYGSSAHAAAMLWSPDKTKFAAYVDTYPSSIVVYDALNWKPLAHWECGQVMSEAKFDFANDGTLVELRDHDLTELDMKQLGDSLN
jgi:hypothetical protein